MGMTPLHSGIVLPGFSKLEYANRTQVYKCTKGASTLRHLARKVHVPNCILSVKDKVRFGGG